MKKLFSLLLAAILALCVSGSCLAGYNKETDLIKTLDSPIYYMISLDDGTVMFNKQENKKTPAAAFVKLLASVVALEKWGNLEESVEISEKALSLVGYDYGVRVADLKVGETYTKKQLVDTLIVYGANDVSSVIAYELSGSTEAFVKEMQSLADKIGCKNTVLKNITGFDEDGQYTTAADVAAIIKYAMSYPVFSEAFSASSVTLPQTAENEERTYSASNKMLNQTISSYYHSSVTGGKQTSTDKAGQCIAAVSSQDGYSYLTVVMGGKYDDIDKDGSEENTCVTDAKKLVAWVYENIRFRVVATTNQTVTVVNVAAARNSDTLRLVPEKEISALVPAGATSDSVLIEPIKETVPQKLSAPISAGQVICQAKILYAENEIATINLVAANDVQLSVFRLIMTGVGKVISSVPFIILEVLALIAVGVYFYITFKKTTAKKDGKAQPAAKKTAAKNAPAKAKRPQAKNARPSGNVKNVTKR